MEVNKEKLHAFKKVLDGALKKAYALEDALAELAGGAPQTVWDVLLGRSTEVKITALFVKARGLASGLAQNLREVTVQAQGLVDAKSATSVLKDRIDEGVEMMQLALNELSHRDQDALTPKRLQMMIDFLYSGCKSLKAVSIQLEDVFKIK